jgi:hypothetical protein
MAEVYPRSVAQSVLELLAVRCTGLYLSLNTAALESCKPVGWGCTRTFGLADTNFVAEFKNECLTHHFSPSRFKGILVCEKDAEPSVPGDFIA